jgi:hypothetical protein
MSNYEENQEYDDKDYFKPIFNVNPPFLDVINVQMNEDFATLLIELIQNQQGRVSRELWAFKKALADPHGCQDYRKKKRHNQDTEYYDENE